MKPGFYAMQTYEEYLATMHSYNFFPLDRELWQDWQVYYNGYYKQSN